MLVPVLRHYAIAIGPPLALAMSVSAAMAQEGKKPDSIEEEAVDAVTAPLSDLNLRKKRIPPILRIAMAQPYALDGFANNCPAIARELSRLNEVLGPDADEEREGEGLINKGLEQGSKILYDFIPFRSMIRRLSGAKKHQAEWREAIYSGVARRSFLKGYALGIGCDLEKEQKPQSPQEVLGLPEDF